MLLLKTFENFEFTENEVQLNNNFTEKTYYSNFLWHIFILNILILDGETQVTWFVLS